MKLIALLIATAAPSCGALQPASVDPTPPPPPAYTTTVTEHGLNVTTATICLDDGWTFDVTAQPVADTGLWHLISGYDVVSEWMPVHESYTFNVGTLTPGQSAGTVGMQWKLEEDGAAAARWDVVTVDNPGC